MHRVGTKFLAYARFTEFLTHAESSRFAHAGLYPNPQRDSYADSEISDQDHSQSDTDSNSDRHSNTHAIVTRPEDHPNADANAFARGCVTGHPDSYSPKFFSLS